jgi:hypothetical protein
MRRVGRIRPLKRYWRDLQDGKISARKIHADYGEAVLRSVEGMCRVDGRSA